MQGCCADFTRRLTEYVLLKNGVSEGPFTFQPELGDDGDGTDRLPRFYDPPDLGVRSYMKISLSSRVVEGDAKERLDALKLLRKILPSSIGAALARQWVLCESCGSSQYEEESQTHAATFMAHVQENSLLICGLPFSKLDKKSAKKLLVARRQRLADLLETATDAEAILDLRIMQLYQHAKNLIGMPTKRLRKAILQMLSKE